jgi:Bacterial Ig-like domain (group 2)
MTRAALSRGYFLLAAVILGLACGGSTEPADPTVPARVVLAPDTLTTYPGPSWPLDLPTATVYNSAHQVILHGVTWTSDNPSIATIRHNTLVQGVAEGTATLTATAGSASATTEVTIVHEPVSAVMASIAAPYFLYADDSVHFTAYALGAGGDSLPGRVVTITAVDPAIATITPAGMVHLHSSGTAWFRLTSEGVSDSIDIISDVRRVARLTIVPDSVQLVLGQDYPSWSCHMYDANNTDLGNRPIRWSSSDTTVAQPTYCNALARAVGSTIITGIADTASAHVNVTVVAAP